MTVLFGWAEASKRAELGRTELRPGQYLPKGCWPAYWASTC